MTSPPGAYKLKYRIISCTSEDPEFPANELLTPSPQSRGWQSMRFCDYPQEMTLQFMGPIRLRQIQFLSHQAKIASKIDLFVYSQEGGDAEPSPEIKYRKLGYLSLDSNERSGWQARELKSVYMDSPALYLKIQYQRCYVNKFNLFNQVSFFNIFFSFIAIFNNNGINYILYSKGVVIYPFFFIFLLLLIRSE